MKYNNTLKILALATVISAICTVAEARTNIDIPGRHTASVSAYIYDLQGDSILSDIDSQRMLVPASITKAITTAAATQLLDSAYRFTTIVELVGKDGGNGVWNGDLRVTAGGDPTLQSAQFPAYNGICDSVAVYLKRRGIHTLTGIVQLVDTLPDQGPISYWSIEDTPHPYGAGHFDINWRDNRTVLTPATGVTNPYVPGLKVNKKRTRSSSIRRGVDSDVVTITGPNVNKRTFAINTTMPDPAMAFEYELVKTLNDNGIEIGMNDEAADANAPAYELYTHHSPQLVEIMRNLMHRSDNMFAEGVLRALAPGQSREEALHREMRLWNSLGMDTVTITIHDGSGLSRTNSFNARFLGNILQKMASNKTYVSLFPIAGDSGTVKSFLADTDLDGRLALKSGSMNGVQCYAGYALDDVTGEPSHVVVLMANRFTCSRQALRQAFTRYLLDTLKY